MADTIDMDSIEQLKELMGDKFGGLVEVYTSNADKYVQAMRDGLAADNAQAVVDAVHPLKSSSGNLGLALMSEVCTDIEERAKALAEEGGDVAQLSDDIEQVAKLQASGRTLLESQV